MTGTANPPETNGQDILIQGDPKGVRRHHIGRPRLMLAGGALLMAVALTGAATWELTSGPPDASPSVATPRPAASFKQPSTKPRGIEVPRDVTFVNIRTGQAKLLPRSIRLLSPVSHFQVSPDGTHLAFNGSGRIYVAHVDGTQIRALDDVDTEAAPSWSPNGDHVAFNVGGNLWVLDVSTKEKTLVIQSNRTIYHPNFSSDGDQILFTRKWGANLAMWTVSASGGPATVLLRKPTGGAFGTYSPDGESIAFRRTSFDGSDITEMTSADLWIAHADGHNAHPFSRRGAWFVQGDPGALWPMWSPDGRHIVYEQLLLHGVYVRDVRTGETSQVTGKGGTRPTWLDSHTLIVEHR